MAVRKIPKNYRNVTSCRFLSFEVQPVEINWIDSNGKVRKYTPDVLVYYDDGADLKPTIFEVKYRSDLKKNWDKLKRI